MRKLIHRIEGFSGVRVLTYALMTNHIHLLLEEPDCETVVSDDVLIERMGMLYREEEMVEILERWTLWEAQGNIDAVYCDKDRYRNMMHDISFFMKSLKHRFSFWYNRMHGRKGTFWAERFKSVLVEGGDVLRTVAAYIEMNPVRAGMVDDPSVYRYCGFGEAMGGSVLARDGIVELMVQKGRVFGGEVERDWQALSSVYLDEVLLYGAARADGQDLSMMDERRLRARLGAAVDLSAAKRLMYRCRYFTDGQVLGSKAFVEAFFAGNRDRFGPRRTSGGRRVKGDWGDLYAVRDVGRMT